MKHSLVTPVPIRLMHWFVYSCRAMQCIQRGVSHATAAQVLHPADSLDSGALSDGYVCAWLHPLPPCNCFLFAPVPRLCNIFLLSQI